MLVEEFAGRLAIEGVDANYTSTHVQRGSLLALPFPDGRFPRALCLDVLEHLAYEDQPKALAELHRVLAPGGELLVSVPNLAHLQSRVHFLLTGRLIRTANEVKHPGDRPLAEYRRLFDRAGFDILDRARRLPDGADPHLLDPPQAGRSRLAAHRPDASAAVAVAVVPGDRHAAAPLLEPLVGSHSRRRLRILPRTRRHAPRHPPILLPCWTA